MKPYEPNQLPLEDLDYKRLFPFVAEANAEVSRYDGMLKGIVEPQIMLSPLTNEEAVLSSKIEGTQATIDEVLEQEAGLVKEGEKRNDIHEIINYRQSLLWAQEYLEEYPISLPFIRQLHKTLLDSVRGKDKDPGEFRKDQNWIGAPGSTQEQATFVPPNPLQLQDHLNAWQAYMVLDDIEKLLQTAVVHAQFELLHPFKDGNGRIGRLLIPLFLYKKGVLSLPMFYLSSDLEAHRDEYYQRLQNISREGDWDSWIEFFLKAVIRQAQSNSHKVKVMMSLYDEMKQRIQEITHSQYTIQTLDAIFARPTFRPADFARRTGINRSTAIALLGKLREAGILKELLPRRGRRASILYFPPLLELTTGGNTS